MLDKLQDQPYDTIQIQSSRMFPNGQLQLKIKNEEDVEKLRSVVKKTCHNGRNPTKIKERENNNSEYTQQNNR